ncbi:hypothetical protein M422DRAFT_776445 [Sphaerobolus stellatus SS14]|nr:hypothetical protein M422DRAFT_776445 [Sphaerobolus stellatus SS14]
MMNLLRTRKRSTTTARVPALNQPVATPMPSSPKPIKSGTRSYTLSASTNTQGSPSHEQKVHEDMYSTPKSGTRTENTSPQATCMPRIQLTPRRRPQTATPTMSQRVVSSPFTTPAKTSHSPNKDPRRMAFDSPRIARSRTPTPGAPSRRLYEDGMPSEPPIEKERRNLSKIKAQLEAEVKDGIEFLRLLRGRREKVAAEGERLRRSVSPEKRPTTPSPSASKVRSMFSMPGRESPPSPSAARKACDEAYAKMTPLERHLMREKYHSRGTGGPGMQKKDGRWDECENCDVPRPRSPQPQPQPIRPGSSHSELRDKDRQRRIQEMREEAQKLAILWREREKREHAEGWKKYQEGWSFLSSRKPGVLKLDDIPWPITQVFVSYPNAKGQGNLDKVFSKESISLFIFSSHHSSDKPKKQRLHEALLRYHPDRFEARWLTRVSGERNEQECVREIVGLVARALGELLREEA